uniref:Uncharacterized protein n=1 Tax=Ascaris lumbricoides TaxID=6252 RepID=A0A0M3I0M6_ASCLU
MNTFLERIILVNGDVPILTDMAIDAIEHFQSDMFVFEDYRRRNEFNYLANRGCQKREEEESNAKHSANAQQSDDESATI